MGFDRAEFLHTLQTITGQSEALPGADLDVLLAAESEVAVNAIHYAFKEKELEDLFKGMKGDDRTLMGGRQRRNGRSEYDLELLNGGRFGIVDDVLIQNSMNILAELQALYDVREQLISDLKDWRTENLSAEENARIDALPVEDQFEATKRLLDEKLANGEISAAKYAEFMRKYEANQNNDNDIARKKEQLTSQDANLSRDENVTLVAHQLSLKRQQLIERRSEIDARLGNNLVLIDRLNTLRARGGSRQDIVDLIDDTPTLSLDIPTDATFDEGATLIEQSVTADSAALEVERVEVGNEMDAVEASQQTLSIAAPETQIDKHAMGYGGNVFEEVGDGTTLTGGFNLALNASAPLDAPKDPADHNADGPQEAHATADLGFKTDLSG